MGNTVDSNGEGDGARAPAPPRKHHRGPRRPDLETVYSINDDGSRNRIHPADVKGKYTNRRRVLWWLLIGVYMALPWLQIGGHPAILIDIENRHFYLFGQTFNAQDFRFAFFFVTGLAFTLFVVSALWGRLWCGYACPHTVFLEGVYRRIERLFEGDAGQRRRLDAQPWKMNKVVRRGGKWGVFLAVSLVLSHTFLSYFMGVDQVFAAITSPPASHPTAFTFIVIFTVIIYFNFAWFREQLCIVICPYGRLQSVLYDKDTVNVTYDEARGEPRGRQTEGACVDCFRCVAVCPTGIDIRNGTQLECVGCAACIDACDEVMDKLELPRGLVRYDSQSGMETGKRRFVRPRLWFYVVLLLAGLTAFTVAASNRSPFAANVLRLPGAAYTLEGGMIRNGFKIHLYNKQPEGRTFVLEPEEQEGWVFSIAAREHDIGSLEDREVVVLISVPEEGWQRDTVARVKVTAGEDELWVEFPLAGPFRRATSGDGR